MCMDSDGNVCASKSINPKTFQNKICQLEKMYSHKNQSLCPGFRLIAVGIFVYFYSTFALAVIHIPFPSFLFQYFLAFYLLSIRMSTAAPLKWLGMTFLIAIFFSQNKTTYEIRQNMPSIFRIISQFWTFFRLKYVIFAVEAEWII